MFDDCWYTDDEGLPVIEAVFLWVPPALAVSDLILNGVFERHPSLRVGIVELSSIWVPQFLLMIDGAHDFTAKLNGKPLVELRDATERLLPRAGAGVVVRLREPEPTHGARWRHLHAVQRLPAFRGNRRPAGRLSARRLRTGGPPGLFHDNVAWLTTTGR